MFQNETRLIDEAIERVRCRGKDGLSVEERERRNGPKKRFYCDLVYIALFKFGKRKKKACYIMLCLFLLSFIRSRVCFCLFLFFIFTVYFFFCIHLGPIWHILNCCFLFCFFPLVLVFIIILFHLVASFSERRPAVLLSHVFQCILLCFFYLVS